MLYRLDKGDIKKSKISLVYVLKMLMLLPTYYEQTLNWCRDSYDRPLSSLPHSHLPFVSPFFGLTRPFWLLYPKKTYVNTLAIKDHKTRLRLFWFGVFFSTEGGIFKRKIKINKKYDFDQEKSKIIQGRKGKKARTRPRKKS